MRFPSPTADSWWQIVATTDPSRAELVADRLLGLGSPGVEERDGDGETILLAGFPDEHTAHRARDVIGELVVRSTVRPVRDDGLDRWREHARPVRTERFVLAPSWGPAVDDPERIVIDIDPERTFGSGSHPTTRLCLDLLASSPTAGRSVLDVGTGSGVLALAAAKLGSDRILATDVDPDSPAVVRANAECNGVADRVAAVDRPLRDLVLHEPPFDLVLANLLAPVIAELGEDLVRALAPGGRLIVSGLLTDRHHETTDALVARGLVRRTVLTADPWCAVALDRPPSRTGAS